MNVLVLLLGGNPLPNYVAADYLLKAGRDDEDVMPIPGKIVFIYSRKTRDFFRTITENKNLNLKPRQYCGINLEEQHREPFVIRKRLLQELKALNNTKDDPIESIHLNYTGGTKPMAVNVFVGINEFLKHSEARVIFSDLDPDHFKIVPTHLDIKEGEAPKYPLSGRGDLRDHVKLDIKGLLNLHAMKVINGGTSTSCYDKNGAALDQFVREKVELYKNPKEASNNSERHEVPTSGEWLEDFVLKVLTDLKDNEDIDVDVIRKGVEAAFEGRMTELDIMVLRGYQLFLVSCTTSHKIKRVKQKAFEALHRARQLGGEHAKVIVVSPMYNKKVEGNSLSNDNNLKCLEKDLEQFEAKRSYLLGIDQLALPESDPQHLKARLKNIIQGGE
jgi:hypothetical protein